MRRATFLLCLVPLVAPLPAPAQDLVGAMQGLFGSATDPAGSCQSNPHRIDFLASPPHLFISWAAPWVNRTGQAETNRRYDILAYDETTFTLRREDEVTFAEDGSRPIWILRHTSNPEGYCWGRSDWPQMRCEDQQLRCDAPVS